MKNGIFKIAVLACLFVSVINIANAQMSLTGELRPRFEYRHGYKTPADSGQGGSGFVSQRTRLNFGYKHESFKVGITLQDVRIWGSQSQLNTYDVNTSGLHEAWGEYNFTKKISMKIGRQELNYDDERIMGSVGWTQQGRSHDAFLLKFTDSAFTAHIGVAYNQNAETSVSTAYTVANNYKEMQYLWLNKQIKSFNISILVLNNSIQSPVEINSTYSSQTSGTRIEFNKKRVFVGGNFYYQSGEDKNKKKISAMEASIDGAYTIKKKFTIGLGYEYLSGQSQTDTTKAYTDINHSFNPLYGTNHKFNGYMDYFYVGNHIDGVGLQDINFKLKYKTQKLTIGFDAHQFLAAAPILNTKELAATGQYKAMDAALGTEYDLTVIYLLSANVSVQAGYSHFLPSPTLSFYKGVKDYKNNGRTDQVSNWGYVMIAFKPDFLSK